MDGAEQGEKGSRLKAGGCGLAGGTQRGRGMPRDERSAQGTPQGTPAVSNVGAKKRTAGKAVMRKADADSGTSADTIGWNDAIHQKVIGRTMTVGGSGLVGRGLLRRSVHSEFSLLDEPASEVRGGIFLEPLIEQRGDFLAQIGGMRETGKFVGLQSIAGSREQEFPGGLGAGLRHDNLQRVAEQEYGTNNNRTVIDDSSAFGGKGLWKGVEKQENVADCCSGCAGDYEDPDWTTWEPDPEEDEEVRGRDDETPPGSGNPE